MVESLWNHTFLIASFFSEIENSWHQLQSEDGDELLRVEELGEGVA